MKARTERIRILEGEAYQMYAIFNETYGVLVDEGRLMLPIEEVELLEVQIARHKAHSDLELEAIGRRTVEDTYPRMVNQFNFDYFKRGC
jgi:hypothetical protein